MLAVIHSLRRVVGSYVMLFAAAIVLLSGCTSNMADHAAGGLPTAQIAVVRQQPVAINISQPVTTRFIAPTPTLTPLVVAAVPTFAPPTDVPPTPTITPVPLPAVQFDSGPTPPLLMLPTPPASIPVVPTATPLPVVQAAAAPGSTPILMYHYVRSVDRTIDPLGYELSVTPDHFAQQLDWLRDNGYATVRMDQLTRCLRGEPICPAKSIALTFDDGYEDAFTTVLPLLQQHGFTATFYIISGVVGQPAYLSWDQVRQLHSAGMEIGAHTVRHLNLTDMDQASANDEVVRSRAEIEHAIQAGVTSFCYPAGHYDGMIEALVRDAGYTNATTTRWDADWSDAFALPRRRVSGDVDGNSFGWIVQN